MAAFFGKPDGQPAPRRVLRADVGRPGGRVAGGRADMAGDLAGARGVPAASDGPRCRRVAAIPRRLGYWPAVFGLFAFVWLELASPDPGSLGAIKLWLWVYLVVTLTGAIVCGDKWFGRADPFEVYSVVASRFSPLRRNPQSGRIEIGNPFDHLPSLPIRPGTVTVLAVLLGSTAFDSFSAMPVWRNFVDRQTESAATATLMRTAGLLVFIAVVVGDVLVGRPGHRRRRPAHPTTGYPGVMAHSLIPIVLGYVFAHYLSYLIETRPADDHRPGRPARPRLESARHLGNAEVNYVLSLHPSVLATIKVCCVVGGHVAGVIAAHDRALRCCSTGYQLTGQLAMMLVMVGYTFTGLYLLFGG